MTSPADEQPISPTHQQPRGSVKEVAAVFARLGFTAFGGPAAHVAMMEEIIVTKRKWVDRQHFLDMLAAVNFIPGPNSTEMAIHLGMIRAGFPGLLVGGFCFITPAVLIILPLAFMYVRSGQLPQVMAAMVGINACVVAIIAAAVVRLAKFTVTDYFTATIALLAIVAGFLGKRYPEYQPDLVILVASALAGAIYYGRPNLASAAPLAASLASSRLLPAWNSDFVKMTLFFLKIGLTLFGSGYVLIPYLESGLVDHFHWLTRRELLDGIAVGQVTPGPLLTTATFLGYLLGADKFGGGSIGGVIGALLATAAIFAPAFVLIALFGPLLPKIRANRFARGGLKAMNAAVIALIFVVCCRLGAAAFAHEGRADFFSIVVATASLAILLATNLNSTWLIVGSGLIGLARLWLIRN